MKIKLYWPNCRLAFIGGEFDGEDAFFLECSLDEARIQLFGKLSHEQIEQCMRNYDPQPNNGAIECGIESDKLCFLLTMDQKTVLLEPWWFPYSGQWNGYGPFRKIKNVEIENLVELLNINVEIEVGDGV